MTEFETAGKTVVIVLVDGAADTVADLTNLTGIAPVLLSGDNPRAATTLAAEVGIDDVRAGLLPQDKAAQTVFGIATDTVDISSPLPRALLEKVGIS